MTEDGAPTPAPDAQEPDAVAPVFLGPVPGAHEPAPEPVPVPAEPLVADATDLHVARAATFAARAADLAARDALVALRAAALQRARVARAQATLAGTRAVYEQALSHLREVRLRVAAATTALTEQLAVVQPPAEVPAAPPAEALLVPLLVAEQLQVAPVLPDVAELQRLALVAQAAADAADVEAAHLAAQLVAAERHLLLADARALLADELVAEEVALAAVVAAEVHLTAARATVLQL